MSEDLLVQLCWQAFHNATPCKAALDKIAAVDVGGCEFWYKNEGGSGCDTCLQCKISSGDRVVPGTSLFDKCSDMSNSVPPGPLQDMPIKTCTPELQDGEDDGDDGFDLLKAVDFCAAKAEVELMISDNEDAAAAGLMASEDENDDESYAPSDVDYAEEAGAIYTKL
jgi:hypothetical protein